MAQFRIYSRGLKPQSWWMCFPLMLQQNQSVSGGIYRQPQERLAVFSYYFVDTNNYYCMWLILLNLKLAWRSLPVRPSSKTVFRPSILPVGDPKVGLLSNLKHIYCICWLVSLFISFFARILSDLHTYIRCCPLEPVWPWVNKGLLLHLVWSSFLHWYPFCCTIWKLYYDSVTSVNYSTSFALIFK